MNTVIDKNAFDNIVNYIDYAGKHGNAEIIYGGNFDDSEGYFMTPL